MKTIIAGSRNFNNCHLFTEEIGQYLTSGGIITEVVSGGARGADSLGEVFARNNNIPLKIFPANWDVHGKAAGPIRNREMANYADCLIAFWDFESTGTKNMINQMIKLDKQVHVIDISNDN